MILLLSSFEVVGKEGNRATLPVSLESLIKMGEYSKLIYTDRGVFAKGEVSPDDPEFYGLNKMIEKQYGVKKNEFSYYVIQEQGTTILIFRGTTNTKNIWTAIDVRTFYDRRLDVNLHKGFRDAAALLLEDIHENYELDHTVYLTGHSLGGAIAQIMGMWIDSWKDENGVKKYNVEIFTFGAPKVTTKFLFNEPKHWRVAIGSDPIPFMPSLPYVHSGIHIDPETLDWNETHHEDSLWSIDSSDHSIKDYLDILYDHSECDAKCRGSQPIRE